jgi:hypothetical protein
VVGIDCIEASNEMLDVLRLAYSNMVYQVSIMYSNLGPHAINLIATRRSGTCGLIRATDHTGQHILFHDRRSYNRHNNIMFISLTL